MLLGGFLMLPVTFDTDSSYRLSKSALGIFAVALLTAGFSLTGLLCFAIRNPLFQADAIFYPSLASCALGLLTVFYDFLVSSRYVWNTPALLVTLAASISTVVYGGLLIFTHRKLGIVKLRLQTAASMQTPLNRATSLNSGASGITNGSRFWQDQSYYENYVQNMYPASAHQPQPVGYDPSSITEEEMQRQQMLMLLLQREQPSTPDQSSSTFRIEWQSQEQDDGGPTRGHYAPGTGTGTLTPGTGTLTPTSAYPPTAHTPHPSMSRQVTNELRPWDGVWRGPPPRGRSMSTDPWTRAVSRERREERRREIELGR